MKSVTSLTQLETEKLLRTQSELREAALRYSNKTGTHDALYIAARRFNQVCEEAGLSDYWIPERVDVGRADYCEKAQLHHTPG